MGPESIEMWLHLHGNIHELKKDFVSLTINARPCVACHSIFIVITLKPRVINCNDGWLCGFFEPSSHIIVAATVTVTSDRFRPVF